MSLLVPVAPTRTLEATVAAAIDRLHTAGGGTLHLVVTTTPAREAATEWVRSALDRAAATARDRAGEAASVRTAVLGTGRYLATPVDHAAVVAAYAREHGVDRVLLDPDYAVDATDPTLRPVDDAFARVGLQTERAAVPRRRRPDRAELVRFAVTALLTFAFALSVGTPWAAFDLATAGLAGLLAGVLFRNVTVETTPSVRRIAATVVRGVAFVPVLLWRILVANVQLSYLLLHPSLPIDPHLDRVDVAVGGGLSVTGFANALTLTPGTLTVDAERTELLVHSVTPGTRREVLDGERERAIRFVFYGAAGTVPDPLERGDVETVAGPVDAAAAGTTSDTKNGDDVTEDGNVDVDGREDGDDDGTEDGNVDANGREDGHDEAEDGRADANGCDDGTTATDGDPA